MCKKPSVQTRGFILALISTYAVGSSGTLPAGCSQPRRESSGTVWGKKKKKKRQQHTPKVEVLTSVRDCSLLFIS